MCVNSRKSNRREEAEIVAPRVAPAQEIEAHQPPLVSSNSSNASRGCVRGHNTPPALSAINSESARMQQEKQKKYEPPLFLLVYNRCIQKGERGDGERFGETLMGPSPYEEELREGEEQEPGQPLIGLPLYEGEQGDGKHAHETKGEVLMGYPYGEE